MTEQNENKIIDKDYFNDLNRIKDTIRANQAKAMVVVNSPMIMTYYEIGTIINERKTWGSKYIENLAKDLKEYGNSYSKRNLEFMSQLSSSFKRDSFTKQPVSEIPWGSLIKIMQKSSSHEEMLWYVNETHKNGWSRSMVINQFALKAYERSLVEPNTTSIVKTDDLSSELFKDTYVFSFLDRER